MTVIQEGNRFQRFYKHCRCHASASGPRIIFREKKRRPVVRPDVVEVEVMLVALACDECDTPWESTYPFAVHAAKKKLKKPTPEEVERCRKLRDEGLTYMEVDERMGWAQARGSRSWRILNDKRAFRRRSRR